MVIFIRLNFKLAFLISLTKPNELHLWLLSVRIQQIYFGQALPDKAHSSKST